MTARVAAGTPVWRDVRVVRVVLQVVFLAAVVALLVYLWDNLQSRLQNLNVETGYDFLDQPTGFQIPFSDFRSSQPISEGFRVAAKNTAVSAAAGIVICTVLGLVVGIARLSTNWLVRKVAAVYVETLRNLPPLLIIIFANNAVLLDLPPVAEAHTLGSWAVISNNELAVASPVTGDGSGGWFAVLALALAAAVGVTWWRHRVQDRTGALARPLLYAWLPFGVVAVASYLLLDGPVTMSRPGVDGFQIAGGVALNVPYAAVTLGLGLYTSSHVAEIVRGSILAVPRGQTEAATALGLRPVARLRHVVLPQAFRVAVPPTVNQYLNLTKNTSLGIAVAYMELTTFAFIAIGNGQPAPQTVSVSMAIYLSFSIVIAVLMNVYNRSLGLRER